MSLITAFYLQIATFWELTGVDGENQPQFALPIQLNVRWEDRTDYLRTKQGEQITSRSRVFVPQTIKVGDYLFLGTNAETDPRTVVNAYRVLDYREIPDLFNQEVERRVIL